MSAYRYFATDLITGALRATEIPLRVTSLSRNLGGVGQPGQLKGTLDLKVLTSSAASFLLSALEPRRTLLWALQDNYPIWAGPVWDWQHQSAASHQLPIIADELGSLFAHRQIRNDQTYTGVDELDVIRSLINYALGKSGGGVAQLVMTTNESGVTVTESFPAANLNKVLDAVNQICTKYNLEYSFDPGLSSTSAPIITLRVGTAATMGRPYSATQLQLIYPGRAVDYMWPRLGSQGTNSMLAIASGSGGTAWASNFSTHGLDSADLAAGYPLMENSVSYTGSVINGQSQIDAYADYQQQLVQRSPTAGRVSIAGGQTPTVQQVQLGDHAMFVATSTYHPAPATGGPGLVVDGRIIGWTVYPPSADQVERTDYFLGGVST